MQLEVKVAFWSGNWVQRRPSHEHTIISCGFVCLHPLRKSIWLKFAIIYELCILNAPLVLLLLQLLILPDHRQTSSASSGRVQSTSGRSLQLCRLKRGCRLNPVRVQAEQKWLPSPRPEAANVAPQPALAALWLSDPGRCSFYKDLQLSFGDWCEHPHMGIWKSWVHMWSFHRQVCLCH